jgi:hypothetical protein
MPVSHAIAVRNAIVAEVTNRLDQGSLRPTGRLVFFDKNQVAVAHLNFGNPAFHRPADGMAFAYFIDQDPNPVTGAIPTRFEAQDRDGRVVWSGSVGPGGDFDYPNEPFLTGARIHVKEFFYRAPL